VHGESGQEGWVVTVEGMINTKFNLWEKAIPQFKGGRRISGGECGYEMVLKGLNTTLGTVSPMLARRAILDRYLFCFE
jgi:hypothetical protein